MVAVGGQRRKRNPTKRMRSIITRFSSVPPPSHKSKFPLSAYQSQLEFICARQQHGKNCDCSYLAVGDR